jgi:hypothetical protein
LNWDPVIRRLLDQRGLDVTQTEALALVAQQPEQRPATGGWGCSASKTDTAFHDLGLVLLTLGVIPRRFRRARRGFGRLGVLWSALALAFGSGCLRKRQDKTLKELVAAAGALGPQLSYSCNRAELSGTSLDPSPRVVALALLKEARDPKATGAASAGQTLLVFDGSRDDPSSAVQVRLLPGTHRIDRILLLDGRPHSRDMGAGGRFLDEVSAVRMAHASLATMLFEALPRAEGPSGLPAGDASSSRDPETLTFSITGLGAFQAEFSAQGSAAQGNDAAGAALRPFPRVPQRILRGGALVCERVDGT